MKKLPYLISSFIIVFNIFINTTDAQWVQTNGPWGGTINCIASNGNYLYAGTPSGVFRSTDNGRSWQSSNAGLSSYYSIKAFASIGDDLFAAVPSHGIFVSKDNGQNWQLASSGIWNIYCLASKDSILFAGVSTGFYRTTNLGKSWIGSNKGFPTDSPILTISFLGDTVFTGTYDGVFFSTDNGSNWVSTNNNDLPKYNPTVNVLTSEGGMLYAGTQNGGIYRSLDHGANWTSSNNGLTSTDITALTSINASLYAVGYNYQTNTSIIYKSNNKGISWNALNLKIPISNINTVAGSYNNIFVGTDTTGILLSTDNGNTWSVESHGISYVEPTCFTSSGDTLLLGTRNTGIYFSVDKGEEWKMISDGLGSTYYSCLTVYNNNIFVGTAAGVVYRSKDRGKSWEIVYDNNRQAGIINITISNTKVYIGTNGNGIFSSSDNGSTWISSNKGLSNLNILGLVSKNKSLIASTSDNGIYRYNFQDSIWTSINNGLKLNYYGYLAIYDDILYLGTDDALYYSTDEGTSWTFIDYVPSLVSLSFSGNKLFLSGRLWDWGIFETTNKGLHWSSVSYALPEVNRNNIGILYENNDYLFYGSPNTGIWRRPISEMVSVNPEPYNIQKILNFFKTIPILLIQVQQ